MVTRNKPVRAQVLTVIKKRNSGTSGTSGKGVLPTETELLTQNSAVMASKLWYNSRLPQKARTIGPLFNQLRH